MCKSLVIVILLLASSVAHADDNLVNLLQTGDNNLGIQQQSGGALNVMIAEQGGGSGNTVTQGQIAGAGNSAFGSQSGFQLFLNQDFRFSSDGIATAAQVGFTDTTQQVSYGSQNVRMEAGQTSTVPGSALNNVINQASHNSIDDQLSATQVGNFNQTYQYFSGIANDSSVLQVGTSNYALINNSAGATRSESLISQDGQFNNVFGSQNASTDTTYHSNQSGDFNSSTVAQDGSSGNFAAHAQLGSSNAASSTQQ
jgi:hypothetical protein